MQCVSFAAIFTDVLCRWTATPRSVCVFKGLGLMQAALLLASACLLHSCCRKLEQSDLQKLCMLCCFWSGFCWLLHCTGSQ